jgi:hypothetical protein
MKRTAWAALPLLLILTACGGGSADTAGHEGHGASATAPGHDHSGHEDGAHEGAGHHHPVIADSGVGTLLATGDGFGNELREAPADARPTVALRVVADPGGGWTVQVPTSGFRWSPEDVNTPADAGTGHAHLYAGASGSGESKVARIYGEWAFLSGSAAQAGDTLTVVLYADDHSAWGVDGRPVQAEVTLPALPA